ncbi:MarR family winged helix-turn-helix transcriptional regulator [Methylocapsa palsarum]|uniref:DNA-binding transcriptional regulator, MarR family n=1 Tax=Methylocapsa palsarum TaxID=1612308 RepID=A0A1I3Z589_9HYPH|nr:MarR family winged helix-turn-helix transcriptional regulator [Methylocapsa palsarum]SFK39255.1 DNA-binding transcriptional regulator, MarR family [Methylocapsa palsarum]
MIEKVRSASSAEDALNSDAPKLDQQFCFAVYSTQHALNKIYAPLLERLGLTYPQYLVMLVLWETDDLTVKAIGNRLQLDSGTLTPLLKRVEAMGLIGRARDPGDERQVRVKLSASGSRLRREAKGIASEVSRATGRSNDDLKAIRKDLRKVRNALLGKRDKPDGKVPAG